MKRLVGCSVVGFTLVGVCAWAQEDAKPKTAVLESGQYEMRLTVKEMGKGKDDVRLPAQVEVENEKIIIETQGMSGNKILLKGMIKNGQVKAGMTGTEEGKILSFHYLGKVESEKKALGTLFCFADGAALFSGRWALTKKMGT